MKIYKYHLLAGFGFVLLVIAAGASGFFEHYGLTLAEPLERATPAASALLEQQSLPQGALSLFVEPAASTTPILTAIAGATQSVDLVIYDLKDPQVEAALVAAYARGVAVRVLLNEGYYGKKEARNEAAYAYLQKAGVPVKWTPNYFALTHQKTLVVDARKAFILTFNLTPRYYGGSRDFGIVDTNPQDVAAIEKVFENDWIGSRWPAEEARDLVWSPGSRDEMLALINGSQTSIKIYNEEMAVPEVTAALAAAVARGVDVQVAMTYSTSWKKAFIQLAQAGVRVRTYTSSAKNIYIHAKMILVDEKIAFLGSENFSNTSLNDNRELGIIISDPNIIKTLSTTFSADFAAARPYSPK